MQEISLYTLKQKYSYQKKENWEDIVTRVSKVTSSVEKDKKYWQKRFFDSIIDMKFLPGGRILAGVGTPKRNVTYSNCYVVPPVPDDFNGIFDRLKEVAVTLRFGGGVGIDFSQLRPEGALIKTTGGKASGPISFMKIYNTMSSSVQSSNRRGALIGLLSIDNYDIDKFIYAKDGTKKLSMFNISVKVTDKFMKAVENDDYWILRYQGMERKKYKAVELLDMITKHTYDYNEPGVIFIDNMIKENNLWYVEGDNLGVNPCAEQVLGADYGACLLGSINLTKFVNIETSEFDFDSFKETIEIAIRFLDDILDINIYPLPQQKEKANNTRRVGLGVLGYASTLVLLRKKYGDKNFTEKLFRILMTESYRVSNELGKEKGNFPLFDKENYWKSGFLKRNLDVIKEEYPKFNTRYMRNSHLLSIAPTGTISIIADNVSSGIEPIFSLEYERNVKSFETGEILRFDVKDYAYNFVKGDKSYKEFLMTYKDIPVNFKLETLSLIQQYIDSSISNTTNIPHNYPYEDFKDIYYKSYKLGLKGVTTYRQGTMDAVLIDKEEKKKYTYPKPKKRPKVLKSTTYKQKMLDKSYYITISDIYDEDNEILRPFEIFINSTKYSPDATAVAILLSAEFRRLNEYDDYNFLIHNLRKIEDPDIVVWENKRRIRSLYQAISYILEDHINSLKNSNNSNKSEYNISEGKENNGTIEDIDLSICPICGVKALKIEDGCNYCLNCGYSKCG